MIASSVPSLDLTGLDAVPFSEIAADFNALLDDPREERVDALDGLLVGRSLRLFKEGSRAEALDEALHLARLLDSEVGNRVEEIDPIAFGAWHGYRQLLTESARRSDPLFVDTLLRSTSGHGERILEILAEFEEPIPRATLRKQLGLSESNLSHLLRNLEEGELVLRTRKGREVFVELGRIGRQVVERQLRPAWVDSIVALLEQLAAGESLAVSPRTLQEELTQQGAPSTQVAQRLAAAVCRLLPPAATTTSGPRPVVQAAREGDDRDRMMGCTPEASSGQLWSTGDALRRTA